MKRILCIWLPRWPIQRLRRARPELSSRWKTSDLRVSGVAADSFGGECPGGLARTAGQASGGSRRPVVLYASRRGADRVVACSAEAEALGVIVGMPLAEATALGGGSDACDAWLGHAENTGRSPHAHDRRGHDTRRKEFSPQKLLAFPYDPLADRRAMEALAQWCGQYSPTVGVEDAEAAECVLLDISGLTHLFGDEASLGRRIVGDLSAGGLDIRLAVADTLGAAWAAAHYPAAFGAHGCGDASPVMIPPGETLAALRPLPLAALRLADATIDLLRQLGIERIGQLESLPRDGLLSRFGPDLLRRWDQAVGRLAEPVPACAPSPQFEAHWSPEHPTARRETVEAALEHLLGQVAATLLGHGRGAVRLECRLECLAGQSTRAKPVAVSVGLFRPSAAAGHLWSLVRIQLERLRLPGPVLSIGVTATATAPLLHEQQGLFAPDDDWAEGDCSPYVGNEINPRHPSAPGPRPPAPGPQPLAASQHAHDLAELVERLSSRLGHRAVLQVRLLRDAQPELAFCYEPMVGLARRRNARRRSPAELPPRPLHLLARAVALDVTSVVPENPPACFHFRGRRHRVARHWGPERIQTGWWRGRVVGRDYYRVETTAGGRYWLFRRLRDGRWFLHGLFE